MMAYIGRNCIFNVIFFLILYIYIYNPPFAALPFPPLKILYIFIFSFFTNNLINNFNKTFKTENYIYLLIISYSFIRFLVGGDKIVFIVDFFSYFDTFIIGYTITCSFIKYSKSNFIIFLMYVTGSASLITLILISFPTLNNFIRDILLTTSEYTKFITFRSFGLSEGLTYGYGIVQGIALSIIIYIYRENKILLFFVPLHLITIMFNARIGFIPPIIMIMYMIVSRNRIKSLLGLILFTFLLIIVIFSIPIFEEYQSTINWALSFFTEVSDALQGNIESNTNMAAYTDSMLIFPKNFYEWVIGSGEYIFLRDYDNSDMGYILQLNFGGLSYLICIFSLLSYMYFNLKKYNIRYSWFNILFVGTLFITNIKGNAFISSPSFRLIFLLYIYIILESKKSLIHLKGGLCNLKNDRISYGDIANQIK